jgi:hypothetical protein
MVMNRTGRWGDRSGQVSFAVVAIVLLVASSLTGTYLAKRQMDEMDAGKHAKLLDAMEYAIKKAVQELSLLAATEAQKTVSGWDSFPVNETEISCSFSDRMAEHIRAAYPRDDGRFKLDLANWSGGLFFIEQKTFDLVPSNSSAAASLDVEGSKMDFSKLPTPSAEVLGERTVNPFYVAVGNFSVKVSQGTVTLSKQSSFQRPIISALPFLETKLRAFESSSDGEFSDLGKMVSYMLTTLCELRVLEGYGQPMYTGLDASEILTEQDVHRAVSVGLLLEQARLFRAFDPTFESAVAGLCGGGSLGTLALSSSKPRYLDPAELFLWFLGKTTPGIDTHTVIAQAMYGLSDQLCVKVLDYMGWLGALDGAASALDNIEQTMDLVMSRLTGEDKAKETVITWITKTLNRAGGGSSPFEPLFSGNGDFAIPVPQRQYFVEDAAGNLYPVWVGNISAVLDLPSYDVLSSDEWRDFYPAFKGSQSSISTLVRDSVTRLAFDIAGIAELDMGQTSIDPADGKDIFSALADGTGSVKIKLDQRALSSAAKDLPLFSEEYVLAQSLMDFIFKKDLDLVDRPGLLQDAYSELASKIISSAKHAYIPNLAVPVEEQIRGMVNSDLESDSSWGIGSTATTFIDAVCRQRLNQIGSVVSSSVAQTDDGFAGPLVDSVASMLIMGAQGFPGLKSAIEDSLTGFSHGVLSQKEMSAFKDSVYMDLVNPFEFWEGDRGSAVGKGGVMTESLSVSVPDGLPEMQVVPFDNAAGLDSLDNMFPTGDLLVQVKRPWQFDRGRSEYPNVHMTSIFNLSATPFTTQWTVSVLGMMEMVTSSTDSAFQSLLSDGTIHSSSKVRIELSFPVVLHSAWALQGVEYNPSNTALSDTVAVAKKFIDTVWKKLEPAFGWIKDGLERLYRFIGHAFETLASFATKMVKTVASALQTLVETLQTYVQKIADSVLGKAVRAFIDITGRVEFRISLYGFVVIVQTNLPDLIYRHGTDMLRLIVCTNRLGPGISVGVRIARMSDGSFDIIANGTLTMRQLSVDVRVDPLMHVMRRLVELHCVAEKWAMDLMIPEVEPYELAQVSTADIPGVGAFLSNIPIPVLGLSASIEAGLRLKYSAPFPTDVVINEFESNPLGIDSDKEWVELYNPMDKPRCIDGWSVATQHGKSNSLVLTGTIPRNGLMVFEVPGVFIDNGAPGDPFNDGDSLVLLDPAGLIVDSTPMLADAANDDRTWQRSWDGGPKWIFAQGTMGNSNGVPVLLATSDFIAKALFEAFKQAFTETQLQEVTASLDFLVLFAKRVLNDFIENMISLVGEIVHEVTFFIKVTVNDASGSAGAGFRTSFVVTGGAIVELLRWLIHSFATFIVNLGRASHPIAYPTFPREFFAGLYVRFELLFEVGVPRMVRVLGATGIVGQRFECAVVVSPNMPALGKIVGKDWGNWSIDFGVCLSGVPKEFASAFLLKDTGDLIDFWIVKARLYGV